MAKTLLVALILIELLFSWELWRHGPPMVTTDVKEIRPGEISFRMTPASPSVEDYAVLSVVITVQAALVGFLWWTRHRIARN